MSDVPSRPGAGTHSPVRRLADRAGPAATDALGRVLRQPAHVGVFALVIGLLSGPRVPAVAVAAAGAALLAAAALRHVERAPGVDGAQGAWDAATEGAAAPGGEIERAVRRAELRRGAALLLIAAVAVLVGAEAGALRLAALERSTLETGSGARLATEELTVTQASRVAPFGGWSAMVRLRGEPVLLRVADPAADRPEVGTILAVTGRLRAPGEYAQRRHAHAELRAERTEPQGLRGGPAGLVDGVRRRAERALDRGLPPTAAALFRGMVLGQDDALDEPTRDAFRAAGLSHLVAASGTNVVLLAALAAGLGTALGLGLSGRLWLVLALILLYVPLAGGGASIQRAGVMGAAAVAAGLIGRGASRWYALGLAGAVTLLLDPRAAAEPGWQLSFVAVLALLVLAPGWRRRLVRRGVPPALAEVTAMTGAATLATAPVIAAHFGQASLVGLPANVLAAPAVAPVMWLGVLASAIGQVTALGGPAAAVTGPLVDGLNALAGFPLGYLAWVGSRAANAPGAVLEAGPGPVLVATVGVLALLTSAQARRAAPGLACVSTAAWLAFVPPRPAPAATPRGFRLTFLDVGQGDATLLQAGKRSVLVDTGPPDGGVVDRLRAAGVHRLDLLVLTHAQLDHDGAALAVVDAVPVAGLLDGRDGASAPGDRALDDGIVRAGLRRISGRAGQRLQIGGLQLRVLWPPGRSGRPVAGEDPNDRAIVLEAEAGGTRSLLSADAESDVLSRLDLRPVDLLKVAHHGSADPGLPALLRRLRPRIAGIEVGEGNAYGHPAPETLSALAAAPAVVRTDRDGSVRAERGPDGRWELRRAR